jgi:hypothetical protein
MGARMSIPIHYLSVPYNLLPGTDSFILRSVKNMLRVVAG